MSVTTADRRGMDAMVALDMDTLMHVELDPA